MVKLVYTLALGASAVRRESSSLSIRTVCLVNFQKLYKKHDLSHLRLLRLLSQEIVLMKKARISAQEAFDWQSKLLKDAIGCGVK